MKSIPATSIQRPAVERSRLSRRSTASAAGCCWRSCCSAPPSRWCSRGLQWYVDYERDVGAIESRVKEITGGYHDSLARSLWNVDAEQIRVQLEGIMRLPDLRSASVAENASPGLKAPLQVAIRAPGFAPGSVPAH